MAETREFTDLVQMARGFMPDVPLVRLDAVGDAAIAGNGVLYSRYGEPRSWRGLSHANQPAAALLHRLADTLLAGNVSGNVWRRDGTTIYFIGKGAVNYGDQWAQIGLANSQLQVYLEATGQTFAVGLPAPSPPELTLATDSFGAVVQGQVNGDVSAQLTRVRTVTGDESPTSGTSNVVNFLNGRARLLIPAALEAQGQDEWGIYFTPHGSGGIGPHQLLKFIEEADIAGFTNAYLCGGAGDAVTTIFGGATSVASSGRLAAIVLRPAAVTLPSFRGSSLAVTAGKASTIRAQRPQAAQDGDYMLVHIVFDAVHEVMPGTGNKGVEGIASVTGVWMAGPTPLNPNGEKIIVEQISTNQFRWRLESSVIWTTSALNVAATALGGTGLSITWTANVTGGDEVGNTFTIDPFALVPPAGWPNVIEWQNNAVDTVGIGIFGKHLAPGEAFFEWTTNRAARMFALAAGVADVDTTTPVVQTNSVATAAVVNHQVPLLGGAPAATELVVLAFAGDPTAVFTPSLPIAPFTNTDTQPRGLDFDFINDDLLDITPPKNIEGPPAATHGCAIGPLTVLVGALDGTFVAPSKPLQPGQFDLTQGVNLNPAEPPVRLDNNPDDGSTFVFTRNSIQTLAFTGDEITPLSVRTFVSNVGIAGASAACQARTGIYLFSARGRLTKVSGYERAETDFADAVAKYTRDWNAREVVLGEDRELDVVAACFRQVVLLYYQELGIWSAPLRIAEFVPVGSRIFSAATIDGRLVLSVGTSEADCELYRFDVGAGGEWFLRSVPRTGGFPHQVKTLEGFSLTANFDAGPVQLTYARQSSLIEDQCQLYAPSTDVGGYAVMDALATSARMQRGKLRWEWEIPQIAAEVFGVLGTRTQLSHIGTPGPVAALSYNSGVLSWRVTNTNILEFWQGAVRLVQFPGVQAGDKVRIDLAADGTVKGVMLHSGAIVNEINFTLVAADWVADWYGWKVAVVTPQARVGVGTLGGFGTVGTLKLYKNFDDVNGRPAAYTKNYDANGRVEYDWAWPNLNNCKSFAVEVAGDSFEQIPSAVAFAGNVNDCHQSVRMGTT